MPARLSCHIHSLAFALILGLSNGWGIDCRAAAWYTVTDLGPNSWDNSQVAEAKAQHPRLGLTLSDAEKAALPSVAGLPRPSTPENPWRQVTAHQNTDSGIVLGTGVVGILYASGPSLAYGYTQKQADGSFGPFVPLAINGVASVDEHGHIVDEVHGQTVPLVLMNGSYPLQGLGSLDAQGRILISNGLGQTLFDLNAGTATDLKSLLPAGTFGPGSLYDDTISTTSMSADGTIFATVFASSPSDGFGDGSTEHVLMFTPTSVPEPSTLAAFAVLGVGLAVTRHRRLKR